MIPKILALILRKLLQYYCDNDEQYLLEQQRDARNKAMIQLAAALNNSFFDGDGIMDYLKAD